MKNSSDIIVNRTRDLPACSAVPQLTVPLRFVAVRISDLIYCALFSRWRQLLVPIVNEIRPVCFITHTHFLFGGKIEQIIKRRQSGRNASNFYLVT